MIDPDFYVASDPSPLKTECVGYIHSVRPEAVVVGWPSPRALERAKAMVLVPGWRQDMTALRELRKFQETGKPVLTYDPDEEHGYRLRGEHGVVVNSEVRSFPSGADRHVSDHKPDFEAFLSPSVLRDFGRYMQTHTVRADGTRRTGDNWKRGIPSDQYLKSLLRHVLDLWSLQGGSEVIDYDGNPVTFHDALGGIFFNTQGFWHNLLSPAGPAVTVDA